jgi:hypothetical protein
MLSLHMPDQYALLAAALYGAAFGFGWAVGAGAFNLLCAALRAMRGK